MIQVKKTSGGYIDIPYRADAVLVNLGALMQNWTSDYYVATVRWSTFNSLRLGECWECEWVCARIKIL